MLQYKLFTCLNKKTLLTCVENIALLGDSRNYMPLILVPSSAKHITTQILIITKLYGRKDFILRVFIIVPARNYLFKGTNLNARMRCESCSILRMLMLMIVNINDVNGVVLVSLFLTVNIFQTLF